MSLAERWIPILMLLGGAGTLLGTPAWGAPPRERGTARGDVLPCDCSSEFIEGGPGGPDLGFCAEWNPEFVHGGYQCCPKIRGRGRHRAACDPSRSKGNHCDEMTPAQRLYSEAAASGKLGDLLAYLSRELYRSRREQSFCTVDNGFLAWGRRVIPTAQNRIQLRVPGRCVDFGTDEMATLLEWVGRRVASEYPAPKFAGIRLLVGDVSAPRGGCLSGRRGRRGHASHTTGQDADIGFLTVKEGRESPGNFHNQFDPATNWWLIKQFFQNPYVCTKVIFLDRRLIRKLPKVAAGDPAWPKIRGFIRHVRGHRNHMHVRIGSGPGQPGCMADIESEVRQEEEEMPSDANLPEQGMEGGVPALDPPPASAVPAPLVSPSAKPAP